MAPPLRGGRGLRPTAAVTAAVVTALTAAGAPPSVAAASLTSCDLLFGREVNAFLYCQELPGSVSASLYWSPTPDGRSLLMALRADTPGWAGFAFSDNEQMVGNDAVVGSTTTDGETSAAAYRLGGKRSSSVTRLVAADAATAGLTNMAAQRSSPSVMTVFWTAALPAGEPADGLKGAIWAVGEPLEEEGQLQRHTARAWGQIDFGKSDVSTISTVEEGGGADGGGSTTGNPTTANGTLEATPPSSDSDADSDDEETAPTPATEEGEDSDDENESACFPSDVTVTLASGKVVRMDALSVGDEVAVGGGRTSPVFLFSHADPAARTQFVRVSGVAKTAGVSGVGGVAPPPTLLTASEGHYVYVNGRLAAAGTIVGGDRLRGADGADTVVVGSVDRVVRAGLWNPHTLSGELLVGGRVVASTYTTAVAPTVARAALAPLAAAWSATGGWRGGVGAAATAAEVCRRQVARWLPRGAAVLGASA
ncbi:hypothetical protein MMPV_006966 [Pyropia vietnamensis]